MRGRMPCPKTTAAAARKDPSGTTDGTGWRLLGDCACGVKRERVTDEGAVDGGKAHAVSLAYPQQETVERISRGRLRGHDGDDMPKLDGDDPKSCSQSNLLHDPQGQSGVQLSQPRLDGDLPEGENTDDVLYRWARKIRQQMRPSFAEPTAEDVEQDVRIDKDRRRHSGSGRIKKSSGSGSSKSSAIYGIGFV